MKIAQVTPVYPPYNGGIGAVAFEYANQLVRRGHQVDVLTPEYRSGGNDRRKSVKDNDTLTCVSPNVIRLKPVVKFGNAALVPEIRAHLDNYDLVHLHYPFFGGADFVSQWKTMSKVPLVTTYHMDVKGVGLKSLIFRTYGAMIRAGVLKASDAILVSSADYAEHSQIASFMRHHKDRFAEMPFGVDAQRFQPGSSQTIRARLNIPSNAPVVIFVGGLDKAHYFKGVPVLLRALQLMKDKSCELIVVGKGSRKKVFESMAVDKGMKNRIHFVGGVSSEELPEYYRAADLHVLPAIDRSEAFGIVTLEAAASGLPSIVSNLPGVRSVIKEGETGLLSAPKNVRSLRDSLTELVQDQALCRKMGQAARKRVEEKYDRNLLIDRLEQIYEDLCNQ